MSICSGVVHLHVCVCVLYAVRFIAFLRTREHVMSGCACVLNVVHVLILHVHALCLHLEVRNYVSGIVRVYFFGCCSVCMHPRINACTFLISSAFPIACVCVHACVWECVLVCCWHSESCV